MKMAFITVEMCVTVSSELYDKLEKAKLLNIVDFICSDPEQLSQKCDITFKDVLALRRIVLGSKSCLPIAGDDFYEDVLTSVAILSTGSKSLNALLDGGLYTSEITEIYGSVGSGKTQICLSTAISVAHETDQQVIYMDTGGSFDSGRLHDILEAKSFSEKEMVDISARITCCQVFDVFELLNELQQFKDNVSHSTCKLLIVDCIASVISPILGGQHTDGHSYMIHIARYLKSIAVDFSIAVLITNNAVYGENNSLKPALVVLDLGHVNLQTRSGEYCRNGNSWRNIPNTRVEIRKDQVPIGDTGQLSLTKERHAALVKSCRQATEGTTVFQITDSGLADT